MNKEEDTYIENPFSLRLYTLQSEISNSFMKREGFKIGQNNYHILTDDEKYVSDTGKIFMELREVIEQLHFIKIFLRRFPQKKLYTENGISNLEYIRYHTETLYHKIHTISEIMKLLVNQVYKLGIPKRNCNWNSLTQKMNKTTPCLETITLYFDSFEGVIESRHINSHRGIYHDDEVDIIEKEFGLGIYKISEALGREPSIEHKQMFPQILIDYKIKELRKQRIKLVSNCEQITKEIMKIFLTSLNKEFAKNTKTLYNIGYEQIAGNTVKSAILDTK